MFEGIKKIIGKKNGSTSIILAGVHGNEKCGVEAFKKILQDIQIDRGQVFFVYGNPKAIEENKRFIEANLNRMFKNENLFSKYEMESYEYGRAQFLKNYLNQADALLDIHASLTPNSTPFVICEPNAKTIAKYLPVNLIVSGFDKIEPGGTDYYMNSLGKIGMCVECGYNNDPSSSEIAEKAIFAFLKIRGHLFNDLMPQKKSYLKIHTSYTTKTNDFNLSKSFADFEEVSAGQIIGIDGDQTVSTQKNAIILFARNRKKIGDEAFLLGEKKNSLV